MQVKNVIANQSNKWKTLKRLIFWLTGWLKSASKEVAGKVIKHWQKMWLYKDDSTDFDDFGNND